MTDHGGAASPRTEAGSEPLSIEEEAILDALDEAPAKVIRVIEGRLLARNGAWSRRWVMETLREIERSVVADGLESLE